MRSKSILIIFAAIALTLTILCCKTGKTVDIGSPDKMTNYGTPNPDAPKETIQFGQLAGKWAVTSFDSIPNEGWHESKATWVYKYTLNGFAVEDIWYEKFSDNTNNTKSLGRDFTGKNIRIFNPRSGQWNITWFENGSNTMMAIITAKAHENGNIIMLSPNKSAEITFYDITNNSFRWKSEILVAGKRIVNSRMTAQRIE